MCICINCLHITTCSTYQIIARQHKVKMQVQETSFYPQGSMIHVNFYHTSKVDWDIIECLSFIDAPGQWINKL